MTTEFLPSHLGWIAAIFLLGVLDPEQGLTQSSMPVDLTGVYELVSDDQMLPGRLRSSGGPDQVSLTRSAMATANAADLELDNANDCLPVGPFRMMARPGNLIDILPSPLTGRVFILFEDHYGGLFREVLMDRQHDPELPPSYNGDSVGRWENDALVVDTVNFNEWVWLNSRGAPHSDALRLTERYRLVQGGQFLELEMTAADENVLSEPHTYTRYYRKVDREVPQYVCVDDLVQFEVPRIE